MVDLEALQALYEKWEQWPQSELRDYEISERLKEEWPALRAELLQLRHDVRRVLQATDLNSIGEVDLHEEAMINASAFGREEPNDDDYIAAVRTALDALNES